MKIEHWTIKGFEKMNFVVATMAKNLLLSHSIAIEIMNFDFKL
jgi:hypothetical protein